MIDADDDKHMLTEMAQEIREREREREKSKKKRTVRFILSGRSRIAEQNLCVSFSQIFVWKHFHYSKNVSYGC